MTLVSDIKLIRTDTTLDLSQKAEKGMPLLSNPALLVLSIPSPAAPSLWDKPPTRFLTASLLRFTFSKLESEGGRQDFFRRVPLSSL
jgi:hypothetical protein